MVVDKAVKRPSDYTSSSSRRILYLGGNIELLIVIGDDQQLTFE